LTCINAASTVPGYQSRILNFPGPIVRAAFNTPWKNTNASDNPIAGLRAHSCEHHRRNTNRAGRRFGLRGSDDQGRAAAVIPQESADISVIGGDIDIDKSLIPELDISYFFTENIAAELILAITPHEAQATNTSLGRVGVGYRF
jgi:hypothetical protein